MLAIKSIQLDQVRVSESVESFRVGEQFNAAHTFSYEWFEPSLVSGLEESIDGNQMRRGKLRLFPRMSNDRHVTVETQNGNVTLYAVVT